MDHFSMNLLKPSEGKMNSSDQRKPFDNIEEIIKSTESMMLDDEKPAGPFFHRPPKIFTEINSFQSHSRFPENFFSMPFQDTSGEKEDPIFSPNSKLQKPTSISKFFQNIEPDRGDTPHPKTKLSSTFENNFAAPILKLQLVSAQKFKLEKEDILNLFSRYGKVINVLLRQDSTAYIIFTDIMSALYAQKSLNGYYIPGYDVRLTVSWCSQIDEEEENGIDKRVLNELMEAPIKDTLMSPMKESLMSPMNLFGLNSPSPTIHMLKYTCKYEIQINNDKDFQVARRIIGPKGYNMKRIIELCQKRINDLKIINQIDFLKLRLRGYGSGFKEGPDKRESDEPLHLCISSKYSDVYQMACQYVEELLQTIYQEYKFFCQRTGKKGIENLQIKCLESIPNKENFNSNLREDSLPFGLFQLQPCGNQPFSPLNKPFDTREIEQLIETRNKARRQMNFAEADRIRDKLKSLGVELNDEKGGRGKGTEVTTWKFSKIN